MITAAEPEAPGDITGWDDEVPPCEIFRDSTCGDPCGDPSVALALLRHQDPACGRPLRFRMWVCTYHLKRAEAGLFTCRHCLGQIVLVECL